MAGSIAVASIAVAFVGFVMLISKIMDRTQARRQGDGDPVGWGADGGSDLSQKAPELGEDLFDRVQTGRAGRQKQQPGRGVADRLSDGV